MTDLSTIILIEMVFISILAVFQKSKHTTIVSTIYALSLGLYVSLFNYFEWFEAYQYIGAALLNSLVIVTICNLDKAPRLSVNIVFISLLSIMCNAMGQFFGGGDLYSLLFIGLYLWVIFELIDREQGYAGDFTDNILIAPFRLNDNQRNYLLHKG